MKYNAGTNSLKPYINIIFFVHQIYIFNELQFVACSFINISKTVDKIGEKLLMRHVSRYISCETIDHYIITLTFPVHKNRDAKQLRYSPFSSPRTINKFDCLSMHPPRPFLTANLFTANHAPCLLFSYASDCKYIIPLSYLKLT